MKTLPALILAAFTACIFAPFSAEVAISLLTVVTLIALFIGDYRRHSSTPLAAAALKKAQRLPLAA
ncbi:MAG: hypothetical protein H7343_14385 [Undibacterium sp.]|nr:hypothetical protein [Opitutaceae bacterium]